MHEQTYVTMRVDQTEVRVPPGGIVGRLSSAALRLDDPRVSEAHALVSRRGSELKLLALRRWFEVDGERSAEVTLQEGQHIRLAPGVSLTVTDVQIASASLILRGLCDGPRELEAGVNVLVERDGGIALEPGYSEPCRGTIWSTSTGWAARIDDGPAIDLTLGLRLEVGSTSLRVVGRTARASASTVGGFDLDPPLRIVLRHDTVHLFRTGNPPVVLNGVPARILSEVALIGVPVPWEVAAREVWTEDRPRHVLRTNWDRNNRSLRRKLKKATIRTDLVRADGRGNVELFLLPGDLVIDET